MPQANKKLIIYIFRQKQDNLAVIGCDSYEIDRDTFVQVNKIATIGDLIKDVLL